MDTSLPDLPQIATRIRSHIIQMVNTAGSGHVGGALGITDVLTYLYFQEMNIDPDNSDMEERDRFILSPAHMVPGLYATLAERGFFPIEQLATLRQTGSRLQGHAYRDLGIGVETTGGSLGQGLSIAIGSAWAARYQELDYHTYALISDGELNEGQTWEALMLAARERLPNLTILLDKNGIQLSDHTQQLMPTEPIVAKLEAFNFYVQEIDAHDFGQIGFALQKAKLGGSKAQIIVLNSTAGKGVSFMENKWQWHGKAPTDEELKSALEELS